MAQYRIPPDSSVVVLSSSIARQVATDLIRGDEAIELNDSLKVILNSQKEIIRTQDSSVVILERAKLLQNKVLLDLQGQVDQNRELQEKLEREIIVKRSVITGLGCSTAVLTGILVIFLVK